VIAIEWEKQASGPAMREKETTLRKSMGGDDFPITLAWEGTFSKVHFEYDNTKCQGVRWTLASSGKAFDIGLNRQSEPLICRNPKKMGGMDFCMHMGAEGVLRIFENGSSPYHAPGLKLGSTFAIKFTGHRVEYLCNGIVIHISTKTPEFPLRVQTAFRHPGGKAVDLNLIEE
jgi:hypothetical protein